MANNNITLGLDIDVTQFKSKLKNVYSEANALTSKGLNAILKMDFKFPNASELQKQLNSAMKAVKGIKYKGKGGMVEIGANDLIGAKKAYNQYDKKNTAAQLVGEEAKAYEKLRKAMEAVKNLSEAKSRYDMEQRRTEAAKVSGRVRAAGRKAERDEFAEEKAQKKADELYRRRYAAFSDEQKKVDNERAARLAKLQKEANQRAAANRAAFDRSVSSQTDTRTPELTALRSMYQNGQSRFVDGSSNSNTANLIREKSKALQEQLKLVQELRQIQGGGYSKEYQSTLQQIAAMKQLNKLMEQQKRSRMNGQFASFIAGSTKPNDELARMRSYYQALERSSAQAAQQSKKDAKAMAAEYSKVAAAVRKLDQQMNAMSSGRANTNKTLSDMRSYYQALERSTAKEAAQQDKKNKEMQRAEESYVRQNKLLRGLASLASRYFSIYSVIRFAQNVASVTGYFEQQRVALEGILGSATQAQKVLDDIKNFALKSPFQTKELVTFTKQLAAFGVKNNDLFPTVTKLADISAGLGVDMSRIILAYGQVKSASVLRGQELRQFTEAGIPMVEALAKKFTELNGKLVTTGEVFKLISDRKVSFEMVAEVLSDMTAEGGKFYKMQENITDTLYGQMQKLKDMWTLAMESIGKGSGGFLMNIVKAMQNMIKHARELAVAIGTAFAVNKIATFGTAIVRLITHFKAYVRLMRMTGSLTNIAFGATSVVVGVIASKIYEARLALRDFHRAIGDIEKTIDKDTKKMSDGIDSIAKKLRSMNAGTKEWNDTVSALAQNYGKFINSDIISALQSQGSEALKVAASFEKIAESVKLAIASYNEYRKNVQVKDVARETLQKQGEGQGRTVFENWIGNNNLDESEVLIQDYIKRYGADALQGPSWKQHETIRKKLGELYSNSVTAFSQGDVFTQEEFESIFEKNIKSVFPNISEQELLHAIQLGSSTMFDSKGTAKTTSGGLNMGEVLQELLNRDTDVKSTDYYRVREDFEAVNTGALKDGDFIDQERNATRAYIDALNSTLDRFYGDGIAALEEAKDEDLNDGQRSFLSAYKDLMQSIKDSIGFVDEDGNFIDNFDNADVAKINEKYNKFFELFAQLPDELIDQTDIEGFAKLMEGRNVSGQIWDTFREFAKQRTGHAQRIADNITAHTDWRNDEDLKSIVIRYMPTDENYEQKREELVSEASSVQKKYDQMSTGPEHAKDRAMLKKQLDLYTILKSDAYYGIDKQSKSGGGGGGYRRLFADMFSLIKEARDAEKKLVEGVDGYTDALIEDINKLEKSPLKDFYSGADGNPFDKFLNNIKQYGLETEIFKPEEFDALRNEYMQNVGPDGISVADYEKIWSKLIEMINQKANSLSGKKGMESTVDALKAFAIERTKQMEQIFGRDEIEDLISKALKELTGISKKFDDQQKLRGYYDRIGKAGNYYSAGASLGINSVRFDQSAFAQSKLLSMLNSTPGVTYDGGPGKLLKDLIQGGSMSIGNLGMLTSLASQLSDEAFKRQVEAGDDEGKTQAAEQFKSAIGPINEAISQLAEGIVSDEERRLATLSTDDKDYNTIANLLKQMKDDLDIIANDKTSGSQRTIDAIQRNYAGIAGVIGAGGYGDYINRLYGSSETRTGVSERGMRLGMLFGSGGLEGIIANKMMKDFYDENSSKYQTNDERAKAEEEQVKRIKDTIAKLKLFGDVLSKINAGTQAAGDAANAIIDMVDATNGVVMGEDGLYKQERDPANSEIAKQTISTITQFSQGVSDSFQSLMSGDIFGAVMGVVKTLANFFQNIFGIGDSVIQKEQDKNTRAIQVLTRSIDDLNYNLQDVAGVDKWANMAEQMRKYQESADLNRRNAKLETEKKGGDAEKAQDFADQAKQDERTVKDLVRNIKEQILGTADELAAALTDPLVDAFRNGENAARAWRDSVRSYIGDVLKEVLMTNVIAPRIKKIMDDFFANAGENPDDNSIISLFSNEGLVKGLVSDLDNAGTEMIDLFNSFPQSLQDLISYNSQKQNISGGIQGITEDTGRTLEGLGNSMLFQLVMQTDSLDGINQIADAQLRQLQGIRANVDAIEALTRALHQDFNDVRYGIRPLHVTID